MIAEDLDSIHILYAARSGGTFCLKLTLGYDRLKSRYTWPDWSVKIVIYKKGPARLVRENSYIQKRPARLVRENSYIQKRAE